MEYKKCPFCNESNEVDTKFCIYCGREFPVDDNPSSDEDRKSAEKQNTINCPACNTLNDPEKIECRKCGYLLNEDIKKTLVTSKREYRKCPKCGGIFLQNEYICSMCGYDFSDLKIYYDSSDNRFNDSTNNFFKNHPECRQYRKNIDFFKEINKFHDYDAFLFEFRQLCEEKNIDLSFFDIGMVKCPECSDFFSFLSPHFIINQDCPHCANKFDLDLNESYCLNCGRPVRQNQTKCQCGYEFADIKCPRCKNSNEYTNNYCTSCGRGLWSSNVTFSHARPRGCLYENGMMILNWNFLKREIVKNPHQINGEIHKEVLREQYLRLDRISNEISSRWWIVSPFMCKSCTGKIEPFQESCPKCGIAHYTDDYCNRAKELKSMDNYVESERDTGELSNLKWTYKLTDTDWDDYHNSLAPKIGESQLNYMQRLVKEWGEVSVIKYLIKSEWNIYFEDECINCGGKFEKYIMNCPSCGMKKDVTALGVLFSDDNTVKEAFPFQYKDFINDVKNICRYNGSDLNYIDDGIACCPQCSNYFNILTEDFVDTHRCPHCGVHFNITTKIYQNDPLGEKRCPNCGDKMNLEFYYVNYGDLEGEEARYECPSCGYSQVQHEDYWQ